MTKPKLAINGGQKLRRTPLPYRRLFDEDELNQIISVFKNSYKEKQDFGYQGKYEKLYTEKFCEFQGGGYADGVSSGTAGIYIALNALGLKKGSDVIISPVTDPGGVSPVVLSGMNPVVADSDVDSFNVGPDQFEAALTSDTNAAIITHLGGNPVDIDPILEIASDKDIKIIEDCSQAHGALYKKKRVGCFGDIAVFSTMYSKNHSTGGCGGIVFTQNKDYYWLARSFADRGKPFNDPNFNQKDPSEFLFPAMNFNLDELSCAIGINTLEKLQHTIDRRIDIVKKINKALKQTKCVDPIPIPEFAVPSPFFLTVKVDINNLKVTKKEFAQAIAAEGISINPDYRYVVAEWKWMKKYFKKNTSTPNAQKFRNETFNILFNERLEDNDIGDIIKCIIKVEEVLTN